MPLLPFSGYPLTVTSVTPGTYTATNLTVNKYGQLTAAASGSGGGGGTVTSVSVVTAHGVSGSVATATTTPAITLTLGAITPTSVNGLTISSSTGTLTIANSKTLTASNTLTLAGTDGKTLTVNNSLTLAGTDGKTLTVGNSLTLAGTDSTTMTFPSSSGTVATLAASQALTNKDLTGSGNTFPTFNQNTTGTANIAGGALGAIPYQSAANTTTVLSATSTANQVLMSGASAAPVWSTPTYPNASSPTSRTIIVSDGTNWTASTETWATPGSSGHLLQSDGTNWASVAIPTWNQNTTGTAASAAALSISGQTGLLSVTGLTNTNRIKTVRDAADTLLELAGSYTPTGTWVWTSASVTWPTFNQNTSGTAANLSGTPALPNGTTATTQSALDSSTKLATTAYTDSAVSAAVQGLSIKDSVVAGTTGSETYTILAGNVTIIAGTTLDGQSPSVGDRILVKDAPASTGSGSANSTQPGNGIYTITSNVTNLAISRSADMSGSNGPLGAFTFVEGGTANADAGFVVSVPSTDGSFTYGTNNIKWTQFSGAGEISAGTGLSKSGNTISIENSGVLLPQHGGTGVANNSASTLTISGSYATTLTVTNTTGVTLPTSGTLVSSVTTGNGVSASNTAGALSFTLGVITPTSVNGLTLQANSTGFQIAGGTTSKTLTVSNSLTLAGTDGTTMTFPSSSDTVVTLGATQTLTYKTLTSPTITGATMNATTIATDTTTGLTIGTATGQKLGFFNANPVVQQLATADLGTVLSNLGLRASGTAYPITTSGTVTFTSTSNAYGTPTSITLTNATGLPVSTGVSGLGTGVATFLATPSSANLLTALTTSTGTGTNVFSISPALTGTPTAPTQTTGDNTTAIATDAFVQTAVTQPNVLQDAFMGSVFQNIDGTTENITLTASEDFIVDEQLEIGTTKTLEIPSTTSLEIESWVDQPFVNSMQINNAVGTVLESTQIQQAIILPPNQDFIVDNLMELSPQFPFEIPNNSSLEIAGYYNANNPPAVLAPASVTATNINTSAITLGQTSITGSINTASTTVVQAVGLSVTVNVPTGGRLIEISISGGYITNGTAPKNTYWSIWRGTVGSGTQLGGTQFTFGTANYSANPALTALDPTAPSETVTYNVGYYTDSSGTAQFTATSTTPVILIVKAL